MYFDCANERGLAVAGLNFPPVYADFPHEPVSWGRRELAAWGTGVSMRGIPGDACSPSRFVRAAYASAHYPVKDNERENVSRLFRTLGGVQMVEGTAAVSDGRLEETLFTSGYSSSTNTYYVNSYDDFAIRAFPMSDFDQDGIEIQTRPMR